MNLYVAVYRVGCDVLVLGTSIEDALGKLDNVDDVVEIYKLEDREEQV